jgi:hypothetical protein
MIIPAVDEITAWRNIGNVVGNRGGGRINSTIITAKASPPKFR